MSPEGQRITGSTIWFQHHRDYKVYKYTHKHTHPVKLFTPAKPNFCSGQNMHHSLSLSIVCGSKSEAHGRRIGFLLYKVTKGDV